jgi:hypothetical protein
VVGETSSETLFFPSPRKTGPTGDIPRQEKLDYVDRVLDLPELTVIQDAIISSLGVEHILHHRAQLPIRHTEYRAPLGVCRQRCRFAV